MIDPLTLALIAQMGVGVAGKIKSGVQNRKMKNELADLELDLDNAFNKEYNQDFYQSAIAKSAIGEVKDAVRDSNAQTKQAGVIMGASDESINNKEASNSDLIGKTVNSLASYGQQYKNNLRSQWFNNKMGLANMRRAIDAGEAESWSNLGDNAFQGFKGTFSTMGAGQDEYVPTKN